jgi:uncharacterized protein (TIGR02217 family)
MPNPFSEEKLPVCVRLGSKWLEEYSVEVTTTASGQEHRRLVHPFPRRRTTVYYTKARREIYDELVKFYHRMAGRFIGFRVEAYDDFSTNGQDGVPTALDQPVKKLGTGLYQMTKIYGTTGGMRTIWKPRANTVLVAVNGATIVPDTVDYTTGRFTITSDPSEISVTCGCLFDIPARFDSALEITPLDGKPDYADTNQIDLIELLTP